MRSTLSLLPVLVLLACGGSSGTPPEPISATGFAQEGVELNGPYDLTIEGVTRTVGDSDILSQEIGSPIRIVGTTGTGPIQLEINGRTFTLERSASSPNRAVFSAGNEHVALTTILPASDHAVGVSYFSVIDGNLNSARFVTGLDTDPADLRKVTGTAEFNGGITAALRNGFLDSFGFGDLKMTVDFDRNTISGTAVLEDSNEGEFDFSPVAIAFEQASITQNGFEGTASVAAGDIDGTLVNGRYNGLFFGPNADSVGGQFNGQIEVSTSDQDTFIDGAFLGSK